MSGSSAAMYMMKTSLKIELSPERENTKLCYVLSTTLIEKEGLYWNFRLYIDNPTSGLVKNSFSKGIVKSAPAGVTEIPNSSPATAEYLAGIRSEDTWLNVSQIRDWLAI